MDREGLYTCRRRSGHDRAPCLDWGELHARTSRGTKRIRIYSQATEGHESPEQIAAHSRAMRI
jgi:hypothetical protein